MPWPAARAASARKISDQPLTISSTARNNPITQRASSGHRARIMRPGSTVTTPPKNTQPQPCHGAVLNRHDEAQDSHRDEDGGEHPREHQRREQRASYDHDPRDHVQEPDEHVEKDTLPTRALEGLEQLHATADQREDPEVEDADQGQQEGHPQTDDTEDDREDPQGEQPSPVPAQSPNSGCCENWFACAITPYSPLCSLDPRHGRRLPGTIHRQYLVARATGGVERRARTRGSTGRDPPAWRRARGRPMPRHRVAPARGRSP